MVEHGCLPDRHHTGCLQSGAQRVRAEGAQEYTKETKYGRQFSC
jgi:hypothetical protein